MTDNPKQDDWLKPPEGVVFTHAIIEGQVYTNPETQPRQGARQAMTVNDKLTPEQIIVQSAMVKRWADEVFADCDSNISPNLHSHVQTLAAAVSALAVMVRELAVEI